MLKSKKWVLILISTLVTTAMGIGLVFVIKNNKSSMPADAPQTHALTLSDLNSGKTNFDINSKNDLIVLAQYVNAGNVCAGKIFNLTTDIEFTREQGEYVYFTGIGVAGPTSSSQGSSDKQYSFEGIFNGNGHAIRGFRISNSSTGLDPNVVAYRGFVGNPCLGFFAALGGNAAVNNLKLSNFMLEPITITGSSYRYIGGICGAICPSYSNAGSSKVTISNCVVEDMFVREHSQSITSKISVIGGVVGSTHQSKGTIDADDILVRGMTINSNVLSSKDTIGHIAGLSSSSSAWEDVIYAGTVRYSAIGDSSNQGTLTNVHVSKPSSWSTAITDMSSKGGKNVSGYPWYYSQIYGTEVGEDFPQLRVFMDWKTVTIIGIDATVGTTAAAGNASISIQIPIDGFETFTSKKSSISIYNQQVYSAAGSSLCSGNHGELDRWICNSVTSYEVEYKRIDRAIWVTGEWYYSEGGDNKVEISVNGNAYNPDYDYNDYFLEVPCGRHIYFEYSSPYLKRDENLQKTYYQKLTVYYWPEDGSDKIVIAIYTVKEGYAIRDAGPMFEIIGGNEGGKATYKLDSVKAFELHNDVSIEVVLEPMTYDGSIK